MLPALVLRSSPVPWLNYGFASHLSTACRPRRLEWAAMSDVSKRTRGRYMHLSPTKAFFSLPHQHAFNVPKPTAGHPTACTTEILMLSSQHLSAPRGSSTPSILSIKLQSQHQKRNVSHNAQTSKHHHDITTSTESLPAQPIVANLAEELPVALHASESAHG